MPGWRRRRLIRLVGRTDVVGLLHPSERAPDRSGRDGRIGRPSGWRRRTLRAQGYNSPRCDRRSGARPDPDSTRLLLAAERAVDVGAGILRRGRSHIGALIGKGDRDFATDVDVHVESAVRVSLANDVPEISFLGEEEASEQELGRPSWVFDPIDGTINFARGSPLCAISLSLVIGGQPVLGIVDAPLLGERFIAR